MDIIDRGSGCKKQSMESLEACNYAGGERGLVRQNLMGPCHKDSSCPIHV